MALSEHKTVHHVEFQILNELLFELRMLEYYLYLVRHYGQHVHQTVLNLGAEPLRMDSGYASPSVDYRFDLINVRELDAEPLLASRDWADNALALLAKGSPEKVLDAILPRLRAMKSDDRNFAASTLVVLSGILGLEGTVSNRLSEIGMINIMENKVLGPMLQQPATARHGRQGRAREGDGARHDARHECGVAGWCPADPVRVTGAEIRPFTRVDSRSTGIRNY